MKCNEMLFPVAFIKVFFACFDLIQFPLDDLVNRIIGSNAIYDTECAFGQCCKYAHTCFHTYGMISYSKPLL